MNGKNFNITIKQYETQVQALSEIIDHSNLTPEIVERQLITLFIIRDNIQDYIDREEVLSSDQIHSMNELDRAMYAIVRNAHLTSGVNAGRYRYLFASKDLNWWWRLDRVPNRHDNEITFSDPLTSGIFLASFFLLLTIGIVFVTTEHLFREGLEFVSFLNVGLQLIIGGSLITEQGQEIATNLGKRFEQGIRSIPKRLAGSSSDVFPLEIDATGRAGQGFVVTSLLLFLTAIVTACLIIPYAARATHNLGVRSLQQGDSEGARQFLVLSVQLQPDFLPQSINPFGVNSSATLTQLGELYAELGDLALAQEMYERALNEDTLNVIVHYQLADIYLEQDEIDRAILLLDQGIGLLMSHLSGEIELPLESDEQAQQLLFLTHNELGKAHLHNGNPQIALQDLTASQNLLRSHEALFITPANRDNPPAGAILATEAYYLHAVILNQVIRHVGAECPENPINAVVDDWRAIQRLGSSPANSQSRIWLVQADREIAELYAECGDIINETNN